MACRRRAIEPPATLQGAATWRINAMIPELRRPNTYHIAGCCNRATRHVSEPRITLQGAATWWIHYHDSRATYTTLQGAVTWRNQCHDRATLQGLRIPSAILKIVFRHILFFVYFKMQFGLWRAAAFVSSPIHLLRYVRHQPPVCICHLPVWHLWHCSP